MYEKHFSFKHKPFDLVPNPDFLFLSSTHQKALTYIDYGIKEKIGFILITGEIGSGKTTIIRNLIKNLDSSVRLSKINNTKVSSEQLIAMINEDFGLVIEGKSKTRLLSELNDFLIDQYARKIQPVLLIDEAQNLNADLLEEVRLLSNLETDRAKLLQIIIVGQPELKKTLMLPELLQLRQRININYHIAPLTLEETSGYVRHRLTIAGNPSVIQCHDDMLELIFQFSRGIPRLINILCDFALLTTFVEGKREVTVDIMREVVKDLELNNYWNEAPVPVQEGLKRTEDAELTKTLGEISLRLFQIEDEMKNNLTEVVSLTNKVIYLEHDISALYDILKDLHSRERIKKGAESGQPGVEFTEKKDDEPTEYGDVSMGTLHKVTKQIDLLKDTVNLINNKIKNQ